MYRRITATLGSLAVVGLGLALTSPAAATTGVTTSNITSPADGKHYLLVPYAALPPEVTVTGTSDGTTGDAVDIRCYLNNYEWKNGPTSVPVAADGTFSVSMGKQVPFGTCVLRAVPAGLAGGSNVSSYTGPKLTTEWLGTRTISGGPNDGKVYDYYVEFQSRHAMTDFCSASCGGLWDSRLSFSDGSSSSYLWYANGFLSGNEDNMRSALKIDGHNAFLPTAAADLFSDNAGFKPLTLKVTRNKTKDTYTIKETSVAVRCPSDTFPPTAGTCPNFVTTGVRLERTLFVTDGGRQVRITDVWRSVDGKRHTLSTHYGQAVRAQNPAPPASETAVGLKLPWLSSGFKTFPGVKLYNGTSNAPVSIFVRDDNTSPDGSLLFPRGAVSLNLGPTKVKWAQNGLFWVRNEGLKVPAGGVLKVRQYFVMGTTDAAVAKKAASNRKLLR